MNDLTFRWRPAGGGSADAAGTEAATGTWITVGDPAEPDSDESRVVTVVFHGEWNDPWAEELCARPFAPKFPGQR